jgi:hypothetical protein
MAIPEMARVELRRPPASDKLSPYVRMYAYVGGKYVGQVQVIEPSQGYNDGAAMVTIKVPLSSCAVIESSD